MATYDRTIFARMGTTVYTFDKTVVAASAFTGGSVAERVGVTYAKSVIAAMGIVGAVDRIASIQAVSVRTGGMSRTNATYDKAMDAPSPPLVWFEDENVAPQITMSAGMVKGSPTYNLTAAAVSERSAGMVAGNVEYARSILASLEGSAGATGSLYLPSTYTKSVFAQMTLTNAGALSANELASRDGRRSIRWINRSRRRDTW